MIRILLVIMATIILYSCQQNSNQTSDIKSDTILPKTGSFGKKITEENISEANKLPILIKEKDSLLVKLSGKIVASCEHSGCWMDVDLTTNKKIHVTFLNDEFTIPLDAAGKNVIFEGIATKEIKSVEQLKKEALYNKKIKAEIDAIKQPDTLYTFIANGLIIK